MHLKPGTITGDVVGGTAPPAVDERALRIRLGDEQAGSAGVGLEHLQAFNPAAPAAVQLR